MNSVLEDIRGGSDGIPEFAAEAQKDGGKKVKKQEQYFTKEEEWEYLLDEDSWRKLDLEDLDSDEVEALLSDLGLDNAGGIEAMSSSISPRSDKTTPSATMEEWLLEEVATPVPFEPRRKALQELLEEDSSWGQEEDNAAPLSDNEGAILKLTPAIRTSPGVLDDYQLAATTRSTTLNQLLKLCILDFGCSILHRMSSTKANYHTNVMCSTGFQCLGCVLCDRMISRSIMNNTATRTFHDVKEGGNGKDSSSLLKPELIEVREASLLGALKRKAPRSQVNGSCAFESLLFASC